jgi:hypothetical protein
MCLLTLFAIFNRTSKHSWAHNLKNVAPKSKTQLVKQECNMQNAIALLNYLKHIALQRTKVFTKKFVSAKYATATF